jgi:hypothetical protein
MVTEIIRGSAAQAATSKEDLLKLAQRKSVPKETTLRYAMNVTEEQLYAWFVMAVKAKLHLSPFFAIEAPAVFYPGTVKFDPPTPFTVAEDNGTFIVSVTGSWSWRSVYVIAAIFENLENWVKSDAGARRVGFKKRIKRATFNDIFLMGKTPSISGDRGEPVPVVPSGETAIEDDESDE